MVALIPEIEGVASQVTVKVPVSAEDNGVLVVPDSLEQPVAANDFIGTTKNMLANTVAGKTAGPNAFNLVNKRGMVFIILIGCAWSLRAGEVCLK
jgi:hypothetical protein